MREGKHRESEGRGLDGPRWVGAGVTIAVQASPMPAESLNLSNISM